MHCFACVSVGHKKIREMDLGVFCVVLITCCLFVMLYSETRAVVGLPQGR